MYEKRKEGREKIPRIKINNLPSIVPFSRRPCCERDFAVNGVKKKNFDFSSDTWKSVSRSCKPGKQITNLERKLLSRMCSVARAFFNVSPANNVLADFDKQKIRPESIPCRGATRYYAEYCLTGKHGKPSFYGIGIQCTLINTKQS